MPTMGTQLPDLREGGRSHRGSKGALPRGPERTYRRYEGTRGRMRHRQVYLLTLDHKEPTEEVEIGEDAKESLTQGNEPDKMKQSILMEMMKPKALAMELHQRDRARP